MFVTEGAPKQGRDTALFLAHLDDLRSRLRRYRKIHVICDNAKCHTSEAVAVYLWEHRDRIDLHLLPKYSPDCNPIERVWWNLHDRITRNHQCQSMQELLDLTFAWLGSRNPFKVEDGGLPASPRDSLSLLRELFSNAHGFMGSPSNGDMYAHFAGQTTFYFWADGRKLQPPDPQPGRHQLPSPWERQVGRAFAEWLDRNGFPDLYHEPSTHGTRRHGYVILDKEGFGDVAVANILKRLDRVLKRLLQGVRPRINVADERLLW